MSSLHSANNSKSIRKKGGAVSRLVFGWLATVGWLDGWLVSHGWLVGWLVGFLVLTLVQALARPNLSNILTMGAFDKF